MEPERRAEKGGDGVPYTFAEFVQFYGPAGAKTKWERCAPKSQAKAKAADRANTTPLSSGGDSPAKDAANQASTLKHAQTETIVPPKQAVAKTAAAAPAAAPAAAKAPAAPSPAAKKPAAAPAAATTTKPKDTPGMKKGDHDVVQKVVVVGNSGAGKTCLLRRFADDTFDDSYQATVGVDFKFKTIQANDETKVKIQVWDTAGAERFRHITAAYYRGAHGIAIVYDITDPESLSAVESWHTEVSQYLDQSAKRILIGNKCDLNSTRAVTQQDGQQMAEKFGMLFAETSAKDSTNVDEAFKTLACEVLKAAPAPKAKVAKAKSSQRLQRNEPAQESNCCG